MGSTRILALVCSQGIFFRLFFFFAKPSYLCECREMDKDSSLSKRNPKVPAEKGLPS